MIIIQKLVSLWKLISGSHYFWTVLRQWNVIEKAFTDIEGVINGMIKDGRKMPSHDDIHILLPAISSLLKSGIIEIPGIDDYQVALAIDQINANFMITISDTKDPSKSVSIPGSVGGKP